MTEFEVLVYAQQATYLPKSASVPVQTKLKPSLAAHTTQNINISHNKQAILNKKYLSILFV